MQIRPIRTGEDHSAALERIARLMGAKKDSAAGAELNALATLVDAYEAEHSPMQPPDPVAILEFYLDQNSLSRKALEPLIGSRARVSEVLSGKRPLTLAMIRRLHRSFGISADLLIADARSLSKNNARLAAAPKSRSQQVSGRTTTSHLGKARVAARSGPRS